MSRTYLRTTASSRVSRGSDNLAPSQRIWMAVYPPGRRASHSAQPVPDFDTASREASHEWELIDITTSFEQWMANHEYREQYFASPKLIQPELHGFFGELVESRADANFATSQLRRMLWASSVPALYSGWASR